MNVNDNNGNGKKNKNKKTLKYVLIGVGFFFLFILFAVMSGIKDIRSSYHRERSSQSFEEYLKDNDSDSYEFYKGLEKGMESGTWDSENGFYQP